MKPDELKDVRLINSSIERGLVTKAEFNEFVAGLEDCAEMADVSEVEFVYTNREPKEEVAEA